MAAENISNPQLDEVKLSIQSAYDQFNQAKSSGNNELASELASKIDNLNNIYTEAQGKLVANKEKDKQDSINFLASQRRTESPDSREAYEASLKGGEVTSTEEEAKYLGLKSQNAITNDEIHGHLARVLDAPKNKVDIETGLDGANRAKLALLPTPEEKLSYLQARYPNGVDQIDISGTPAYVLKKPDGGYLLADELGTSVKDFTADIAGEAIPMMVAGATGYATRGLGPKAQSAAVNVAQAATGFVQDIVARKSLGLDANLGEAASRRGKEAITGMAIDGASKLLIGPLARRIGEPIKNELAKKVDQARSLLKEKGIETTAPISYLFGERPLQKQKQQMGRLEEAWIGTGPTVAAQKTVDALSTFKESISGVPTDIYGSALNKLKIESDKLARVVAGSDVNAGKIVQDVLKRRLNETVVKSANKEAVGGAIRNELQAAQSQLKALKDAAYGDFYVNAEGLTMNPGEVASILEKGKQSVSREYQNTGIDNLIDSYKARQGDALEAIRLRNDKSIVKTPEVMDRIAKLSKSGSPLSASEVDDAIKVAKETIPEGGSFSTGKTTLPVAEGASSALRNVQRAKYAERGLAEQWDVVTKAYDDALATNRHLTGKILKTKLGEPTSTATDVLDATLSDPQYIREIIDMAGVTDPAKGQMAREQLKNAYLTKIGLVNDAALDPESLDFNKEIVETLWGVDQAGKANPAFGNNMVQKLQDLQRSFKDKGLSMSGIKAKDVDEYFVSLSNDDKAKIKDKIIKSSMARNAEERFTNNALIKLAQKGNFDALDGDQFAKAMYNGSVSDVTKVMRMMPAGPKASLRADFVSQLMRDLPSTTTATGGKTIMNGPKFLKSLDGEDGKIIEGRIKAVMGKEFFDTFKAACIMADVNHIPLQNLSEAAIKVSASPDKLKFFGVGNVLGWGSDRFMSAAYGLNVLVPFWKTMAKDVGPEQTAKNFKKLYNTTMGGRIGVTAIAHAGRNDPAFQQNINDFLYGRSKEDTDYSSRMNSNIPSNQ